jgi:copper chaperone
MTDITLAIAGMSCAHCLKAVSAAVSGVPGAEIKSVQIGRLEARVQDSSTTEQLRAAIEAAGYRVEGVING